MMKKKQLEELGRKLNYLKELHMRKYGCLSFHLSDSGDRVMLGFNVKGAGFRNVTHFMSYEAMYNVLHYLIYPIDEEIKSQRELAKEYSQK